ncbi:MAG: DUF1028 domain-containing protein [Halolamina sp.]
MTFSICVREEYEVPADADGGHESVADEESDGDDGATAETETHTRFGVAVTTRLPAVGKLCPHVSENAAVATQSLVNVDLGREGVAYVDDGLAVDDALQALLNADDGAAQRQLHGVDAETTFAFSGEECNGWYGHREGEGYTVAGNLLTGEAVVDRVAETYAADAPNGVEAVDADCDPLAKRLVDALAAGHAAGGDKREELTVQSAALQVRTTEATDRGVTPYGHDLRVDATETPVQDLRETYHAATDEFQRAVERYEAAQDDDENESESDGDDDDDAAGDAADRE